MLARLHLAQFFLDMTSLSWFSVDQTRNISRCLCLNSDRLSAISPKWKLSINDHSILRECRAAAYEDVMGSTRSYM